MTAVSTKAELAELTRELKLTSPRLEMNLVVDPHIALGSYVRDPITKFAGVAVARVRRIHETPKIAVQPEVGADGTIRKEEWIPEAQLEVVERPRATPGFEPRFG